MTELEQRLEVSKTILNYYVSSGKIPINSTDENINNYITFSVKLADRLINELTVVSPDNSEIINNDKYECYQIGRLEVDRIMNLPYDDSIKIDLKEEVLKSNIKIVDDLKIDYYCYFSTLFLNVLLNRLNSYKNIEKAENRAYDAREAIANFIQELRNN